MRNLGRIKEQLRSFQFRRLFIEELGWNRPNFSNWDVTTPSGVFRLELVAEKKGMLVLLYVDPRNEIPKKEIRLQIEREVTRNAHEHLIIFSEASRRRQVWQWVRRDPQSGNAVREHAFDLDQDGELLAQKVQALFVDISEEEELTVARVADRARRAFDVEKVTKRFYDRFQQEHEAFLGFVRGIKTVADREWYASLMLNRLMFVYFIQKRGFLAGDTMYLQNRLKRNEALRGKDKFYSFYRVFLRRLFHEGLGSRRRTSELEALLGKVPYLNGGLFEEHEIEKLHPEIDISDEAFARVLEFFEGYTWHLDDRELRGDNEINPDVIGYIFEKYINQKELGAYYTKEDITGFIARNTIVPHVVAEVRRRYPRAFMTAGSVWTVLSSNPNRYIFPSCGYGMDRSIPKEVSDGVAELNSSADPTLSLPGETWREWLTRRARYQQRVEFLKSGQLRSENDLITHNLDSVRFLCDSVISSNDPEFVLAVWRSLQRLTVLDPTCGSGAFLFAALRALEPMYGCCLERMERFNGADSPKVDSKVQAEFGKVLDWVSRHPNRKYFILKSIVLNNLYGVDIMREAVEICKLRLFLKLVAQVRNLEEIEPLPDIDFNIRAGNTLVGFKSANETREKLCESEHGQRRLLSRAEDTLLQKVNEDAEVAARAFNMFRHLQTDEGMGSEKFFESKLELRRRLDSLRIELDRFSAQLYGIRTERADAFSDWREAYRPFHWFIEFYEIMANGGFDVIIGNPPYIELKDLKRYVPKGYSTEPCGNTYALVMERSMDVASGESRIGFIVPVSSVSTDRYESLQDILREKTLHFSNFDDRPSRLFDGLEHIRLTIHIISPAHNQQPQMFSTNYAKWFSEERPSLFENISFVRSTETLVEGSFPKLCSELEGSILKKLGSAQTNIGAQYADEGANIFYSRKVGYFLQVLDFEPRVLDGRGRRRPPSEFKTLTFSNETEAAAALCCLNSNLFYWFVTVFSDCRHLNKREIDNFPIDLSALCAAGRGARLRTLGRRLMGVLNENSEIRKMKFKHDTLTVQCIIPKHGKPVMDQIDAVLGEYLGFSPEEMRFLINYDVKFRMGTV